METLIVKVLLWLVTIVGGATALENWLENYIMGHVPQWAKGLVVPLVSAVFAIFGHLQAGLPFEQALLAALGLTAATTAIHNNPNTTSADWPAPPLAADGVPGVK